MSILKKFGQALETLDEYSDEEYSAYLEYTALKDQCVIEPTTLSACSKKTKVMLEL